LATTVASIRNDDADLSLRQLAVFLNTYLAQHIEHTVPGMGTALNLSKPGITRALDRLSAFGLIKPERDTIDRRNVIVRRTPAGAACFRSLGRYIAGSTNVMRRLSQGILGLLSPLVMTGCVHELGNAVGHHVDQYLQAGLENGTQWSGPVVPNGPNCGKQTTGLLTLGSEKFSFDPFGGVTVIPGKVDRDRLEGSTTIAAPGQKGVAFQFTGTINPRANGQSMIQGTLTSAQCTWRVTFHRE